jgi:hypothetical protein
MVSLRSAGSRFGDETILCNFIPAEELEFNFLFDALKQYDGCHVNMVTNLLATLKLPFKSRFHKKDTPFLNTVYQDGMVTTCLQILTIFS